MIAAAGSIRMATAPGGAPTIPPIPPSSRQSSPPPVRAEMPANIPVDLPIASTPYTARPQVEVTFVGKPPRRDPDVKSVALKLVIPTIALIVLGVFIGGYIAFDGDGGDKRAPKVVVEQSKIVPAKGSQPATENAAAPSEPAAAVAPAPAAEPEVKATVDGVASVEEPAPAAPAAPAVEPVKPLPVPAGQPAFVDVRIDSKPAGATVMIVDRGKTAFLGTTPLRTAVDPSREYDLVFTYTNKPTQLEHLVPSSMQHIEVVLGKPGAKSVEPAAETRVARVEPKPEAKAVEAPKVERSSVKPLRVAKRDVKPEPQAKVTMPETRSTGRITSKIPAFDPAYDPSADAAAPETKTPEVKAEPKAEPKVVEAAPEPAKKTKAELRAEREAEKEAARLAKKAELDAKKAELATKKQEQEAARLAKKQEQEAARIAKKQEQEAARIAKKQEAEAARLAKQARGTFDGMLETPAKGKAKAKQVAEASTEGTISVSSKPSCEILIDGKSTGMTTPQRAIAVPLGKHKVTLVNADIGVKKTLTVVVKAGEPATVVQDFTK